MIPKTLKSCNLQLITPCFCAGAKQQEAELRAASFRGELRWWFRCLGGTQEMEGSVFGSVKGACRASAVAVLVRDIQEQPQFDWKPEQPKNQLINSSYITFFIEKRIGAYLPPGLKFTLELRQLREISAKAKDLLLLAWDCLCNLGAIGARKTRALGAYAPVDQQDQKIPDLIANPQVTNNHFIIKYVDDFEYDSFTKPTVITRLLTDCAQRLKAYRRDSKLHPAGVKKTIPGEYYGISALGNATGGRQCSAVRFRPVLVNNKLQLCIIKAPDITLCKQAKQYNFTNL